MRPLFFIVLEIVLVMAIHLKIRGLKFFEKYLNTIKVIFLDSYNSIFDFFFFMRLQGKEFFSPKMQLLAVKLNKAFIGSQSDMKIASSFDFYSKPCCPKNRPCLRFKVLYVQFIRTCVSIWGGYIIQNYPPAPPLRTTQKYDIFFTITAHSFSLSYRIIFKQGYFTIHIDPQKVLTQLVVLAVST